MLEKLAAQGRWTDYASCDAAIDLDGGRLAFSMWTAPTDRAAVSRSCCPMPRKLGFGELGLPPDDELSLSRILRNGSGGLVLVAAPPGCGKTTALKALLDEARWARPDAAPVCHAPAARDEGLTTFVAGENSATAGEIIRSFVRQGGQSILVPDIGDADCVSRRP